MLVVPSTLDAVTVHAQGALCTRVATVLAEGGRLPTQVRINGLPLSLRPGSLRASVVQGPSGLTVRDIRPTFDVQLPPEVDVPAEHRAVEEARARLAKVSVALDAVNRELRILTKLAPTFPPRKKDEFQPRDAPLAAMLSLASLADSELAAFQARRLDLERQQRDVEAELRMRLQRLQEASSSVRGQRARVYRAAVLTLSGHLPAEHAAKLALEYAVPGARWVPTYDLRLPRTLEEGTLRMRASVLQRTGEDWTGVKLSVSTADLERRAEVPELKALRIGRRQPAPARSGWREPPPGLDELFAGYDATRPPAGAEQAPSPEGASSSELDAAPVEKAMAAPQKELRRPEPPPMMERSRPSRDDLMTTTGSFAPIPRPMSAPAPSAPPPKVMSRPRGGMAPREEAPKMKRMGSAPSRVMEDADEEVLMEEPSEAEESFGGAPPGAGGRGGAPEDQAGAMPLEPSDALLDYDRLELAPADSGSRGRLRPRPTYVTRELLALAAVHVHIDITTLIAVSETEVATVWQAPPPAWSVPPRQSSPHFDARFDVEARAEVPSDGAWHTVPVLSVPVGLSAEYVCVPSVEARAFRTVRVENRTPYPLLAGPVDVTLGDEFLMTSPLPTMAPGATQRLGLGVEESIKVARNTRFDEATGGIFGGATMLTHHVSVELANRLANRVLVEVCERVPAVPAGSEKDIKVEETEVAPFWQKRTPLPGETQVEGERAWRVVLQPGEAQTLKATWTVRIPASKMLGGGNRRT
ncbi:mucoidy inhibitor MuiA family protein [Pyxidicoccus xibeiensis]|uniref:mucoidy inhibitor MuiA family protein n=1 Tax=Pyxidicoccus xibeiensis TaxID=2906759 RepID=UPI0020A7F8B6|nr:mucoidy inhibitor MuiA family protein [Pyxidicoccus xibeiensis]MCP3144498.1 mucoidy inhibitor MuiA family protein [Pyxidicoccus xibeiensis]